MRTLVTALLVFTPAIAFAQLPNAGEAMGQAETETRTAKVQTIDFGKSDQVEGEIIKPLDEGIVAPQHRKTSSLINVRANFVDEVLKSVEDI